ncbi:hypothetical protein Pelo_19725 [Pelomyxa schiedti]|nr:hypothetical protein Pelo_19725 [Pelomyxa schiedti]
MGDRVYEWHLSISDLNRDQWVAYGLIPKRPFDQSNRSPCTTYLYGWSTDSSAFNLPKGTFTFAATGGTEEVTLRYDARTLTLTATWPLHNNATATVRDVPRGLYPAVNIFNHNTVKIT